MDERIWLTSDLHFYHDRDFIWEARGFNSIDEMNSELLYNYNDCVRDEDIVYILGDCALGKSVEESVELLSKLKGRKHLIIGNHDSTLRLAEWSKARIFDFIDFGARLVYKKRHFYLSHYPTLVANYDSWPKVFNLCGHTHTTERFSQIELGCYNVGVDAHNNTPITLDAIIEDLKANRHMIESLR